MRDEYPILFRGETCRLSGTYFLRAQRQGQWTLYFHEGQVTLPGLLQAAGYRTAAIGKCRDESLRRPSRETAHSEVSAIEGRQTDVFRPGTAGCKVEADCLLQVGPRRLCNRW